MTPLQERLLHQQEKNPDLLRSGFYYIGLSQVLSLFLHFVKTRSRFERVKHELGIGLYPDILKELVHDVFSQPEYSREKIYDLFQEVGFHTNENDFIYCELRDCLEAQILNLFPYISAYIPAGNFGIVEGQVLMIYVNPNNDEKLQFFL